MLSGDQNIFWDCVLKLKFLERKGYKVSHFVHSADNFCRPIRGEKKQILLTRESMLPDGNVNRWTATMESAEFLGACSVSPNLLKENGIDLKRLSRIGQKPLELVSQELTLSDWYGVSIPEEGRCAQSVTVEEIKEGYSQLKAKMKRNLKKTGFLEGAIERFEQVWNLYAGGNKCGLLTEAYIAYLRGIFSEFEIKNTVELLKGQPFSILSFWKNHYEEVANLYNQTVGKNGLNSFSVNVQEEEIPYFILENGFRKTAKRKDCGNSFLIPKALMLFLELRTIDSVVIPDKGSSYSKAAVVFEESFKKLFTNSPIFYPVYRVYFNSLDCLQEVEGKFKVPCYLSPFFGEEISFRDFGYNWREVIEEVEKKIEETKNKNPFLWLVEKGILSSSIMERHQKIQKLVADGKERISKEEKKMLREELRIREDLAYLEWTNEIANLLKVLTSLPYWNSRPMWWWTYVVPGWEEEILRNATISQE